MPGSRSLRHVFKKWILLALSVWSLSWIAFSWGDSPTPATNPPPPSAAREFGMSVDEPSWSRATSQPVVFFPEEDPHNNWHTYNPSILPLPAAAADDDDHHSSSTASTFSPYRYLVAARKSQQSRMLYEQEFFFGEIIFCLMNRSFHCITKPQLLSANPTTLDKYGLVEKKLKWGPWGNYVGMEDPRLFWGPKGEPLLLYGMNSQHPDRLRSQWILDMRILMADGSLALEKLVVPHRRVGEPLRNPMELGATLDAKTLSGIEKNWAPFLWQGGIAVHTLLTPKRTVYQLVEERPSNEQATPKGISLQEIPLAADQDFAACYRQGGFRPLLREREFEAHHASNLLRLRWCRRGEACPTGNAEEAAESGDATGDSGGDRGNGDILFAVFHVKDTSRHRYSVFVASWWARPGLPVRSIAGPFQLPQDQETATKEEDEEEEVQEENWAGSKEGPEAPPPPPPPVPTTIQFVTTIHFDRPSANPSLGTLDSTVLVSYGQGDIHGRAMRLRAHDFFQREHLCRASQ